ncbi:MAG: hypothetical protein V1731_00930 [Candidatus Aenigmatarchaeota archaeon]
MRGKQIIMLKDALVVIIAFLLVLGGYFLISIMNVISKTDNATKSVLLLSLITIISAVIQLAILATVDKIRDKMERKK